MKSLFNAILVQICFISTMFGSLQREFAPAYLSAIADFSWGTKYDFNNVKEMVANSQFRIANWDQCKKESDEQIKKGAKDWDTPIGKKSDCGESAFFIIEQLTGIKNCEQRFKDILYQRSSLSNDEYNGKHGSFFKTEKTEYTHKVAKSLFANSYEPQHVLFLFVMGTGAHIFIIEKKCSEKEPIWRVYQSWNTYFTLAEWLGIDQIRLSEIPANFTKLYESFGHGKELNLKELLFFLKHYISYNTEIAEDISCYARMFEVK